ncbi:DUF6157 family protein [Asticcacaulis sp. EMRT-3]|uniref:DUF6157 family protein n=1 Tax=Asticcacaulis sp. EMRT-3 TaxID=3040349 RepID=UPI0024AEF459|nr:DUF6157 family protein [Asticcacaulis sp. EMRT-3]MDI7774237.1 DUF6157 family protein [Asticcacaulis sp. EMRT-3]
MHITNTFITVAEDCPASQGLPPPERDAGPTIARLHYDLLSEHPYEYDIDALNFEVWCRRNHIADAVRDTHREAFFSKGHPCMRASPLTKTYGFGAHYNDAGKIAIYPVDSVAYRKFLTSGGHRIEPAMRNARPSAKTVSTKPAGAHPAARQNRLHPAG